MNVLKTVVHIHTPNGKGLPFNGIWDTGATGTAISSKVVKALGLVPTGGKNVSTANGIVYQDTHIIDVGIPNLALMKDIVATDLGMLSGDCDVLIGMDIIVHGDFSITNHNGVTCMSFRMPSQEHVDYVAQHNAQQAKLAAKSKQFPNDKCKCGSGKKFKDCHGRR